MKAFLMAGTLLAVMLAGCSGGSDESDCGTQDDQGRYIVCMTSAFTFEPKTLEIPVGATVSWRFDGGGAHDTEADDGTWKSPILSDKGATFEHTFTEAGTYDYRCNPHQSQGMVGSIIVA